MSCIIFTESSFHYYCLRQVDAERLPVVTDVIDDRALVTMMVADIKSRRRARHEAKWRYCQSRLALDTHAKAAIAADTTAGTRFRVAA